MTQDYEKYFPKQIIEKHDIILQISNVWLKRWQLGIHNCFYIQSVTCVILGEVHEENTAL